MKRQTAVEWFAIEMAEYLRSNYGDGIICPHILKQAKEMEKGQIKEAFKHGELPPLFINFDSEQYYNETYGGK